MFVSQEECEAKAKEINDSVFGTDRKAKLKMMDAVKKQVDAAAKFALEKALLMKGISATERAAFVSLLKDQKDAINLLLVAGSARNKAAEMLSPIFGYKSGDFIDAFQDVFRKMQAEIQLDLKAPPAG